MLKSDVEAERHARRIWVSLVVTLLAIQVVIGGIAIHLAISDPTVAIVPDYHSVALNWDAHRRARLAPERLGWELAVTVSDVADARGMRAVDLQVDGRDGLPLNELRITGALYHHANATAVAEVEFNSIGRGHYLSMAPMSRAGLWEVELAISGADEPVVFVSTIDVAQR